MKKQDVAKAWRDGEHFAELSDAEQTELPANPADLPALDDEALDSISGGTGAGSSSTSSKGHGYCGTVMDCYQK